MVFVRERGRAHGRRQRRHPDRHERRRRRRPRRGRWPPSSRHGLTAANVNGAGQVVAAGTLEQLAALAADPPAKARVIPLQVAGAFHTAHMAPAVDVLGGCARAITTPATRACRCCPTPTARPSPTAREVLGRLVAPGQQPGPLGPVHADLASTSASPALIEIAPGRHARRPRQARAAGRRDRSPSRPPTTSTRPASCVADARRPPTQAPCTDRRARRLTRPHRPPRAPAPSPPTAQHARILGVGGYRPERVVTNSEIVERIDSSDEWIRERSGIITRRCAADDETRRRHGRGGRPRGARAPPGIDAVAARRRHRRHRHPPLPDPGRRPDARRPARRPPAPAFDISAACAGYCYGIALANDMVRGGSADYVLVVGVEKLSDFTDPHRPRHRRSSSATAPARPSSARPTPRHRPDGLGLRRRAVDSHHADATRWIATARAGRPRGCAPGRRSAWQGQAVFRWAVWGMAPVAQQALDAAGIKADDLDAFIPHQANMRIIDAMVKQLKLPDRHPGRPRHRRRPATPRPPRSRSPPTACCARARRRSGGLALQIGFGAGLVYAAQVVVLP